MLYPKRELRENVNNALNATLSRTINTSGTTLVTLLAILFFGGETIRGFIFALIIGVVVGTAATIFLATPIAYDLMTKRAKTDVEKEWIDSRSANPRGPFFQINLALRPACTIFAGKQTPAWAGCGSAMCKINLILPRLALSLSYGYYRFP